jgi:purine-nucleoside phosphorylase
MSLYSDQVFDDVTKATQAADYISSKIHEKADVAIVLGSGLSSFTHYLENPLKITYHNIPHFPLTTVEGHSGELIFGKVGEKNIWVLSGRFHYYEGYPMNATVFALKVLKFLGVKKVILSNAAGGLNPTFKVGDIMLIEDQIDRFPANPLRGKHDPTFGDRFPDMSEPFNEEWRNLALLKAKELGIPLKKGVYLGTSGPSLETQAEIRYFRFIGGDAVGMSTVPEVISANQLDLKVLGFSVITNECVPTLPTKFTHEEVVLQAHLAGGYLVQLVKNLI